MSFLQSKEAEDTRGAGVHVLEGAPGAQEQALTGDERLGGPKLGQQRLGSRLGRGRVLTGDHQAIDHDMGLPVSRPGKLAAMLLEHVFDQERHDLGQPDGFFFGVGEAGHVLALHQRLSAGRARMSKHTWRVAHRRDRFAGSDHRADQGDRRGVFGQVPQRTMAAGIEHGVEIGRLQRSQLHRGGQRRQRSAIGLEAARGIGLRRHVVALGVERRLSAQRRGQGEPGARVLEHVVRRCELFEPEAGLVAGVAELVVRGEDHQDVHGIAPV